MHSNIDIYSDIFQKIRLKHEATDLIEGLDDILASIFKITGISFIDRINNRFSKDTAYALTYSLHQNKINVNELSAYKNYFNNLQGILLDAKIADLTLAFEPESDLINAISDFLRNTFSDKSILLNIRIDHSIIGGIELIWKGKYFNYSLEKRLDEWFNSYKLPK